MENREIKKICKHKSQTMVRRNKETKQSRYIKLYEIAERLHEKVGQLVYIYKKKLFSRFVLVDLNIKQQPTKL